jgi:hypothetical protein
MRACLGGATASVGRPLWSGGADGPALALARSRPPVALAHALSACIV